LKNYRLVGLCLCALLLQASAAAHAAAALRFSAAPPPLEDGLFLVAWTDRAHPDAAPADDPWPAFPTARAVRTGADWAGLGRDTGYLVAYQAVAFGILYISPQSISNWSSEQKHNYDFSRWTRNVSHPHLDTDVWWINYVMHPYCGMIYYYDARGRGFGPWGSFGYSFFASLLYEFGTEAFAEKPSIQDIFITPIGGALLGIAFDGLWSSILAKGDARNWGESVLLALLDPLGRTNHAVDRLFGFENGRTDIRVLPVFGPSRGGGTYAGIQLSMLW